MTLTNSPRWGLMTLTTVGYDYNPETFLGKIIGGCCALSGVFVLTLPIPIVVNSFATYYKNRSLYIYFLNIMKTRRFMEISTPHLTKTAYCSPSNWTTSK